MHDGGPGSSAALVCWWTSSVFPLAGTPSSNVTAVTAADAQAFPGCPSPHVQLSSTTGNMYGAILLFLLCGSAAATSGRSQLDCSQVSSGCTACYIAPARPQSAPQALKEALATTIGSSSLPASSSDLQFVAAGSSSDGSPSSLDQDTAVAQHHNGGSWGGSGSGSSSSSSSGGSGGWTSGSVLSCTACDTSRGYQLATAADYTQHCGESQKAVQPCCNNRHCLLLDRCA